MALKFFDIGVSETLQSPTLADEIRDRIQSGDIGIVKRFVDRSTAENIRTYLIGIGRSSLPTYKPKDSWFTTEMDTVRQASVTHVLSRNEH